MPALQETTFVVPLGGRTLHTDVSGVSFVDSSGLNLLLSLRRRLHTDGSRLPVTGPRDQSASVPRLTEPDEVLTADDHSAATNSCLRSASVRT
ncbi:STAS domain-containing protein [Streptomyces sp. enrichment culture]|uniref:STAS domain-containing protein n=1 Tax=Streptomyces sp. enrichment culture TaxID=1795815 RepID=UPI003F576906